MAQVQLVRWRGGRMTREFAESQASVAEAVPGFVLTQGGWNAGGVAASAGTHDRDAADYSVIGKTRGEVEAFIEAQRRRGNAAWFRTTRVAKWGVRAHGFSSYHVHVVPNLWGLASAGARHQANEYRAGRDGLAGRGADVGPGHTSDYRRRTWPSYLALPSTSRPSTPTPAPDTRTDLERLLDTMNEAQLEALIYKTLSKFHADDGTRAIGRAQQGAWQALGSAPISGRSDEWGASLRDSIARAAYRAGVAATLSTQILAALSKATPASVDARALASELAPLIPTVQPSMTVEQIAVEVRREIGEALTES